MRQQQAPSGAAYDGTCLIVEDSEFDRERLRRILARAYGGWSSPPASKPRARR